MNERRIQSSVVVRDGEPPQITVLRVYTRTRRGLRRPSRIGHHNSQWIWKGIERPRSDLDCKIREWETKKGAGDGERYRGGRGEGRSWYLHPTISENMSREVVVGYRYHEWRWQERPTLKFSLRVCWGNESTEPPNKKFVVGSSSCHIYHYQNKWGAQEGEERAGRGSRHTVISNIAPLSNLVLNSHSTFDEFVLFCEFWVNVKLSPWKSISW